MNSEIFAMFNYPFIQKAFLAGLLISICSSLIGVSLVLRKNSMIGDGLSHVGFGAFAIATVLNITPLYFAIPIVLASSFLIIKLNSTKMHGDSAIALLSASSLAIGTFVVSITKGVNTDINTYLFGSILSVTDNDIVISVVLFITTILLYTLSYNKIFAITFDEKFAKSVGIKTEKYNIIFASLCSLIVVIGMRIMGSLLISSLIIFPSITSMQVFKKFKSVVISSVVISTLTFTIGLISSYILETPTGATIVIVNLITFLIFKCIEYIKEN